MAAPQVKKAYVDTAAGQVHYRHALPGKPNGETLVMLHKSAASSSSYVPLMEHYSSRGYACYAPDMPGFGGSFDPSEADIQEILSKGTRWYMDLFMEAFEALEIAGSGRRAFHVIGHHSGASLAVEMGVVHPDRVASVTLVGPSVMSAEERAKMKERFFEPFNKPVPDGSHLQKTWDYLSHMGVGGLELHQEQVIDHIRAWKGRNQIYGAIWDQDKEQLMREITPPVLAMCARDDVLEQWDHFENAKQVRPDITAVEIKGANFSLNYDVDGIAKHWTEHILNNTK